MSIFAFMDSIWGAVGVGKDSKGKSPFNNTYDSIVGNTTVFTIGAGTTVNTYSSSMTAITDLQEMFRLFANFSPKNEWGNFFLNHLVYNSGGGQTLYLFGPNKSLGYRLSRNFTSDRYCRTKGLFREGVSAITSLKDHVDDVTWQPRDEAAEKRHMILAMLFSLSLLIWDLCIVYKMKTASSVEGVDTSIGGDSSPNSKASNANIMTLLIFEYIYIQCLEVFERSQCAAHTANNAANDSDKAVEELKSKVNGLETEIGKLKTSIGTYALKTELAAVEQMAKDAKNAAGAAQNTADDAVSNIQSVLPKIKKLEDDLTNLEGFKDAVSN